MSSPIALVRKPGPAFIGAISGHPQKHRIDCQRALNQHGHYVRGLQQAGARVMTLTTLNECPDSPFVEDTAVIFNRNALISSMKAKSRRGEVESVAGEVSAHRTITRLKPPATMDGGDVLITDQTVYVGQSTRTNKDAIATLEECCEKPCVPVPVHRGLHLKSSVSFLGGKLLVIDPTSVETSSFKKFEWIEVDASERYAANCLTLGKFVLLPAGFPKVADKIRAHGFHIIELEMSEFEKADGGVTCLSLIINE
jgi:dimethylargininase